MSREDPVSEAAKAVQEVAKTTGKAIDASQKLGGFVSRYVAGPIGQAMGIIEDKLKYIRWEQQVRLIQRSENLLTEIGLSRPTRAIPLKLAIPLLEAASLEDNDYLLDLWARLLVNAANADSHINLKRAYIEILEQLSPLEAIILQKIYSLPYEEIRHNGVEAHKLPDEVAIWKNFGKRDNLPEPSVEVSLALANLARLDCIDVQKSAGGGEMFKRVIPTLLGKSFVEACTLQVA